MEPFFFDPDQLARLADAKRDAYLSAQPFRHAVIDGLVPEAVAETLLGEFPRPADVEWWEFDSDKERKLASPDERVMGPFTRLVLAQFNSAAFIGFLESLTGITGLVPDPLYFGGGLHQIRRGGFLKIHADFNRHPVTQLHRRLNVLLYLNKGWQDSYGGHLELWDRDMSACRARIAPVFNRAVVFDTGRYSYHGHPEPLACPESETRKSLALYYYTAAAGENEPEDVHNTLFQQPGGPAARARRAAKRVLSHWR